MSKKRTYDEISAEIARVHADIAKGHDRHIKQPLLAALEKEQYEALAAGRAPQNHVNYAAARDHERAVSLQAEIDNIDTQLVDAPEERRGILQSDRAALVAALSLIVAPAEVVEQIQSAESAPVESVQSESEKLQEQLEPLPVVPVAGSDVVPEPVSVGDLNEVAIPDDAPVVVSSDANPSGAAQVEDAAPIVSPTVDDSVADLQSASIEEPALGGKVVSEDGEDSHPSTTAD